MKETLFIYPQNDVHLPEEFHFSHNLCVRLYDDLVWLLKDDKIQKKVNVKIDLKESVETFDVKDEHIIDWLLENGYTDEVDEIISKHLTFAIISDICHFIYQALDSAMNIKMTVAFSLIRKPFLENLLIIEQLLSEEKEFLRRFELDPKDFDPGKIKLERKKELIEEALKRIRNVFLFSTETIFELRWDKDNPKSIYAYSNLATHLVTTRSHSYKTESQNLNLIFSGYDEWDSQLQYFYYFVPYLLFYTTEVIDEYLLSKKVLTKKKYKERRFLRLLGQLLQHDQFDKESQINKLVENMKVTCENCKKENQLFKSDIYSIVHDGYLLCKFCLEDLWVDNKSLKDMINSLMKK